MDFLVPGILFKFHTV